MPQLKFAGMDGAEEATISNFHVKVGDVVKKDDNLFDIEADKAADTITSPYDGKISKINFSAGSSIKIGDIVIDFDGDNVQSSNSDTPVAAEETVISTQKAATINSKNNENTTKTISNPIKKVDNQEHVLATPLARKMAADLNVDLNQITGTGPMGRILKTDIEHFSPNQAVTQTSNQNNNNIKETVSSINLASQKIDVAKIEKFGSVVHQPLSGIRKAIATQMSLSMYTAPHVTLFIDVDATNLVNFRAILKEEAAKPENNLKLTFMPFFVKAVAKALSEERFQLINATMNLADNEILVKKYYNIGMAADTDKGLVVPVIRNADQLTLFETAKTVNSLADKARKGTLKGDEMQGGTFTITNFGSAGLKSGTPIINYPEVAILGIGALENKAVIDNNEIVFHSFFPLSLSIDHRVVDGAPAGYFLKRLKELLESPALILA